MTGAGVMTDIEASTCELASGVACGAECAAPENCANRLANTSAPGLSATDAAAPAGTGPVAGNSWDSRFGTMRTRAKKDWTDHITPVADEVEGPESAFCASRRVHVASHGPETIYLNLLYLYWQGAGRLLPCRQV